MADEWYYAENGESFGPLSGDEMLKLIGQSGDEPLYVWREGMAGWMDAREAPEFSAARRKSRMRPALLLQATQQAIAKGRQTLARQKLGERARHELIAYLAVSAYLCVWFSAVLFYKSTVLRSVGIEFAPFALAAVKALVLGKFILVLEPFKSATGQTGQSPHRRYSQEGFAVHSRLIRALDPRGDCGRPFSWAEAAEVVREIGGGSALQALALAILMFLVLLPYLAFRRLALVFGDLPELLFTLRPPEKIESAGPNRKRLTPPASPTPGSLQLPEPSARVQKRGSHAQGHGDQKAGRSPRSCRDKRLTAEHISCL